jgi:hypothetical protein
MKGRPRAFRELLRQMLDYDAGRRPGAAQIVRMPVMRAYFELLVADNAAPQSGKSARRGIAKPLPNEFLVSLKEALGEEDAPAAEDR